MSQGQDVCIAWHEVREDVPRSGAVYGALGCFLSREGRAKGLVMSNGECHRRDRTSWSV